MELYDHGYGGDFSEDADVHASSPFLGHQIDKDTSLVKTEEEQDIIVIDDDDSVHIKEEELHPPTLPKATQRYDVAAAIRARDEVCSPCVGTLLSISN